MCAVYNALDCDMINAIKIQKTSRSQLFFCGDLGIISVVPQKNLRKFAMCKFTKGNKQIIRGQAWGFEQKLLQGFFFKCNISLACVDIMIP